MERQAHLPLLFVVKEASYEISLHSITVEFER